MTFVCDGCGRTGTEDDLCETEGDCPDEECDGTTHLLEIEYTIGVCVPMTWDTVSGSYVVGPMTTTVGGLFSDACEGPWAPALNEWVDDPLDARWTAEATVKARIK